MALPKLEGRVVVPTGGWAVSVTDNISTRTETVPAGNYYLSDILTEFASQLASGGLTYTVTLSATTGATTITPSAGNTAITWTSTDLRNVLGFTGNLSAASAHTSTGHATHLWLPNCGRTGTTPDPTSASHEFGKPESDTTYVEAPSGVSNRLYWNTRYKETLVFPMVRGSKLWKTLEATTNESYQKFWEEVVRKGLPFRYFTDATNSSLKWPLVATDAAFQIEPVWPAFVGSKACFSVTLPVAKLV